MRSRAIFTAALVAILASLAFGQADSCNMTLVDEWTYVSSENAAGIDMIGNHLLLALRGHVFSFELSAAGELTLLDSLVYPVPGSPPTFAAIGKIAHKDSFVFVVRANTYGPYEETRIVMYTMDEYGLLDSITNYTYDDATYYIQVADTICYLYSAATNYYVLNISNPLSPSMIAQGDFGGPTNPTVFWGEYPYLYNGGYSLVGDIPDMWRRGKFNIMDVSDPDSQFISYSAYSEFGSFYYQSQFLCMTKKDSLLYIGGKNRYIEVYDIETDGSGANYICSYGDSTFYDYAVCICKYENYLFTGGFTVKVYDISDPSEIDLGGYYQIGELAGTTERYYTDICVKDSFIIAMDTRGTDIVRIEVYKYSYVGMGNCEINSIPENLDLRTYPNPFNSHCSIDIPEGYSASIYNIQGRCIVDAINDLPCVNGIYMWDAVNEPSGVYLIRAQSEHNTILTRKVVFIG